MTKTEKIIYYDINKTKQILDEKIDLSKNEAISKLLMKCQIYLFQANSSKCDSLATIAIKIAKERKDDVGLYFASDFKAITSYSGSKNDKSLSTFYSLNEKYDGKDDAFQEAIVNSIIYCLNSTSEYNKMIKYVNKQRQLAERVKDSSALNAYYLNKANLLINLYENDSLDLAIEYSDKAIAICPKWSHYNYNVSLSNKEWVLNNSTPNVEFLKISIQNAKKFNYYEPADYASIIYYYSKIKDKKNCLYYLSLCENKCIENKDYYTLKYIYKFISQLYKNLNEFEKALLYMQKYNKTQDLLNRENSKIKIEELEIKYNTKLVKENIVKQSREKLIWISISGLLLAILLIYLVIAKKRRNNSRQKYNELLKKIEEQENVEETSNRNPGPETKINYDDDFILKIKTGLKKLEAKEDYLKPDFKLSYVAKKLNTNTVYLSNYFNHIINKSFSEYTQELRINYTLKRLQKDVQFRNYTLQAIAEEIGYKDANTFVRVFKKQTNLSPNYYIKELNKSNNKIQ